MIRAVRQGLCGAVLLYMFVVGVHSADQKIVLRAVAMTADNSLSLVDVDLKSGSAVKVKRWESDFAVPRLWGVVASAYSAKTLYFVLSTQYQTPPPFRFIEVDVQSGRSLSMHTDLAANKNLYGSATNGVCFFDDFAPYSTNITTAQRAQWSGSFELSRDQFDVPLAVTTIREDYVLIASNAIYVNVDGKQNVTTQLLLVSHGKLVQQSAFLYPKTAPPNYVVLGSTVFLLQAAASATGSTIVFALWSHDVCPIRGACDGVATVRTIYFGLVTPTAGETKIDTVFFTSDEPGLEFLRQADPIGWSFHYSPSAKVLVVLEDDKLWSVDLKGKATLAPRPSISGFIEG